MATPVERWRSAVAAAGEIGKPVCKRWHSWTGLAASLWDSHWVARRAGRASTAPSGGKGNGTQPGQGATELGFPGPALGKMQGEAARRAGEPSGQREEPPPEGLGGHDLLTEADARCPAGEVMSYHLDRQPGGVGGEAARGKMVQSDAVLEVSDGILDLGVAAMVGLQTAPWSWPPTGT